jgi:hypothetical protein
VSLLLLTKFFLFQKPPLFNKKGGFIFVKLPSFIDMDCLDDLYNRIRLVVEKAIVASNKNNGVRYEILIRKNHKSDKIIVSSQQERSSVYFISSSSFRKDDHKPYSEEQIKINIGIANASVIGDLRDRVLGYSGGGVDFTIFIQQGKLASVQFLHHESRLPLYDKFKQECQAVYH